MILDAMSVTVIALRNSEFYTTMVGIYLKEYWFELFSIFRKYEKVKNKIMWTECDFCHCPIPMMVCWPKEISRFDIFLTFHIFGLSRIRLNQYSLNFNRYNTQQLEKQRWNLVVLGQCSALISKIIFVFQCKRPFSCYISAKTRKRRYLRW